MPIRFRSSTIGSVTELISPQSLKAGLAEFISTLLFVFAGSGSAMAFSKLTADGAATPDGLVAVSLANAFAYSVAVSAAANTSGGHVNPAVTVAAFVGGNITLLSSILYVIAQLLGSIAACLLLKFVTNNMDVSAFLLSDGVGVGNALVFEIIMTFGLVYTFYATAVDPKKGELGIIAPIAIGFIVGANTLAGGAFTGASMNPASSFGRALVSGTWTNHWVYWVGPLVGGAIAGIIYDYLLIWRSVGIPVSDY